VRLPPDAVQAGRGPTRYRKATVALVALNYAVSVRTLCEFSAKVGDLDLRFTPSATALEGIAGHAVVAARRTERSDRYESEVSLSGTFDGLTVRGRADGYDPQRQRVDEVKTFRGDLEAMPANRRALHWAQVQAYGALLCAQRGVAEVELALVYFDVATQEETVLTERHSAASLQQLLADQCQRFRAWAMQEAAHRAARDAALTALRFPHAEFRAGQRPLSAAVYQAATTGRCLIAQAPTGIGKTVGTLFPLLKACPAQAIDKVIFLTAKTPGRALALDALQVLRGGARAAPLRVLELVAREKSCEHPDKACHGDSCPLARGFYDRLPAARSDAVTQAAGDGGGMLDKATLRTLALAHGICPYYLSQELVRWCDAVVGDYNHWFDSNALLYGLALAHEWRVGLLIDEAHNLVERGRLMYTAALRHSDLRAVIGTAPPDIRPALRRLERCWQAIEDLQVDGETTVPYRVYTGVRPDFSSALQQVVSFTTDHLAERPALDSPLLRFYFDALHFTRVLEGFGDHSMVDVSIDEKPASPANDSVLCLRNVVPAAFLKPRFAAAHTATLFSATLNPVAYITDMLGLPDNTACIDIESPFEADQLRVDVASSVSTRYRHRAHSVAPIVDLMAAQFASAPGNYLAFFSSFDYLQQVAASLRDQHPTLPVWEQSRAMDEAAREQFLARFTQTSAGMGFAVLGGAFAEGIDLPGRRLIGAFIATLGLPQVNPVNEHIKARMEHLFGTGRGHDYAYLFPGMQKVVQAAGRVIRGPTDRGVVVLIDDRYRLAKVQRLLPRWWAIKPV
jgi:DNA excision repair protein ERCC-2